MRQGQSPELFRTFFTEVFQQILGIKNVEPALIEPLADNASLRHYDKKEYVIVHGEKQSFLYFVYAGKLRCFATKENGQEITNNFLIVPGEPFICAMSFDSGAEVDDTVQALEDSDLVLVPLSVIALVRKEYPVINNVLVQQLSASFERYHDLMQARTLVPSERVKWLYENHPEWVEQVQKQYLASYLDLDKASFSRYRSALGKMQDGKSRETSA